MIRMVHVSDLHVQCSYPMRKNAIAMSDCCGQAASSAVEVGRAFFYRCGQHRGLVKGSEKGPCHHLVPKHTTAPMPEDGTLQVWMDLAQDEQERGATWRQAAHEAGRSEAIEALKRFDPSLCDDYTDSWFEKVVDTVLDTYREWNEI